MNKSLVLAAGIIAAPVSTAASAGTITITIPRINASEYHVPYVAAWIEPAGGGQARTLAVWYDVDKVGNEPGTKWLADLRTWWRKGGRSLKLPANGVSGATPRTGRTPHHHPHQRQGGGLYPSTSKPRVEDGGRELVSMPLTIPARQRSCHRQSRTGRDHCFHPLKFKLKGSPMTAKPLLLLAAATVGFVAPASAHNAWLLPLHHRAVRHRAKRDRGHGRVDRPLRAEPPAPAC